MSREIVETYNKAQLKEMEDAETLTVPIGASTTDRASAFNATPDAKGINCEDRDSLTVFFYVAGTMPSGTQIVLELFIRSYAAAIATVTKTIVGTYTDELVKFETDDSMILECDHVKITYKFKQGGAQYVVSKLAAQLKKKVIEKDRLEFREAPPYNGIVPLRGWYEQTDAAASLASGVPVVAGTPGYGSFYALNISAAVGAPFTVRLTGTSVDPDTDTLTGSDTEDIAVTGNGWFRTTKQWITAPSIDIVEGSKSATAAIYRFAYFNHRGQDFTVRGERMEWQTGIGAWAMTLKLLHVQQDGSTVTIDSFATTQAATPVRAGGDPGKYERTDFDHFIAGSSGEGLVVEMTQSNVTDFQLEVDYD